MSEPDLDIRALICGSRNWTDRGPIEAIVLGLMEQAIGSFGRLVLIEGCAPGADSFACQMWDGRPGDHGGVRGTHDHLIHEHYPAEWERYRPAGGGKNPAGAIRNRRMLAEGRPQVVFAFTDDLATSKGTKDMVTIAKAAGVPVYVIGHG